MKKTLLVTGGAGFIGSHLVGALVREGHEVRVIDDLSTGSLANLAAVEKEITLERASVLDRAALERISSGCQGIFHLAGVVGVQQSFDEPARVQRVNAEGTLNVLEEARRNRARIVYSSSAAVYGGSAPLPISESSPLEPISPYGAQKVYGEHLIRCFAEAFGIGAVSLRYFNVYGRGQRRDNPYSGVISLLCAACEEGREFTVFGDGAQTRDFISVGDVVRANMLALESSPARGEALNIGTGQSVSLNELIVLVSKCGGRAIPVRHAPPRSGDIPSSVCDPSQAEAVLGFRAQTRLEEGLTGLFAAS